MLEDLDTIVASVRVLITELTEKFWITTEIEDWVNEGAEDVGHETFCLRTWKIVGADVDGTVSEDDIFDDREIRMDSDFIAIDEGKVYYNDVCIYPTTQALMSNYDNKWREQTGDPSQYYLRGDMLGFNRKISEGDTIKFYQIERAVTLTGTTVTPFNGDYRLINFRKLFRDYAVSMCWEKKDEDTKADRWMARYLRGLEKMKELLNIDLNSEYSIVPESSLSHFTKRGTWPDWL